MSHSAPGIRRSLAAILGSALLCSGCLYFASGAGTRFVAVAIWLGAGIGLLAHRMAERAASRPGLPVPRRIVVAGRVGEALILAIAGYSNDWVVKIGDIPLGWMAAMLVLLAAFTGLLTLGAWPAGRMARFKLLWSDLLLLAIVGSGVESQLRPDGFVVERSMQAGLSAVALVALIAIIRDCRTAARARPSDLRS